MLVKCSFISGQTIFHRNIFSKNQWLMHKKYISIGCKSLTRSFIAGVCDLNRTLRIHYRTWKLIILNIIFTIKIENKLRCCYGKEIARIQGVGIVGIQAENTAGYNRNWSTSSSSRRSTLTIEFGLILTKKR